MLRQTERLLKAAADGTRLRVLKMLEPGPLCVCQIVAALGLSQSTVSKHLSILSATGLIEDERRGRWTWYRLARPDSKLGKHLQAFLRCCCAEDPQVAQDLAKVKGRKVQALVACCPPQHQPSRRQP